MSHPYVIVEDATGVVRLPKEAEVLSDVSVGEYIVLNDQCAAKLGDSENRHPDIPTTAAEVATDVASELNLGPEESVTVTAPPAATSVRLLLGGDNEMDASTERMLAADLSGMTLPAEEIIRFEPAVGRVGDTVAVRRLAATPSAPAVRVTAETEVSFTHDPNKERSEGPAEGDSDRFSVPEASVDTDITYNDLGGLDEEIDRIRELIELPIVNPEAFERLSVAPPTGVLMAGPKGTGKTTLSKAVANTVDASFYSIDGPEVLSKYVGQSAEHLRDVFEEAATNAPAIIFIDEIDSIAGKRDDASTSAAERLVSQLLTLMDGLAAAEDVYVLAATNRVDSLDPALRRGGRFDREVEVGVPDQNGRRKIINIHFRDIPTGPDVDINDIVERTNGFVGADVATLARMAAVNAITRAEGTDHSANELVVQHEDIQRALASIEPSALREFHVELPEVTWDDIGGLESAKRQLRQVVQYPLQHDDVYEAYDINTGRGILLTGPSGSGKSMLAGAVAAETNANFITIDASELFNKYLGDSQAKVQRVFDRARDNAPTILVVEDVETIAGVGTADTSGVRQRIYTQLLSELDALSAAGEEVFVIGTTSHLDQLDDAIRRAGRLSTDVTTSVPDEAARRQIFQTHLAEKPVAGDVDIDELVAATEGLVGADIAEIVQTAAIRAAAMTIEDKADSGGDSGTETVSRSTTTPSAPQPIDQIALEAAVNNHLPSRESHPGGNI